MGGVDLVRSPHQPDDDDQSEDDVHDGDLDLGQLQGETVQSAEEVKVPPPAGFAVGFPWIIIICFFE
jgi:hypothetical protein